MYPSACSVGELLPLNSAITQCPVNLRNRQSCLFLREQINHIERALDRGDKILFAHRVGYKFYWYSPSFIHPLLLNGFGRSSDSCLPEAPVSSCFRDQQHLAGNFFAWRVALVASCNESYSI